MKDIVFMVFLAWFSLFFTGCGGSSTTSTQTLPLQKGYVVDSPIAGLSYECGDIVGVTNNDGMFECREFPVTFKIGNLTIGIVYKMPADKKVYPQDIVGKSRTNFTDAKVIALTRFLQSLDDDGDIEKVIKITSQVKEDFTKEQKLSSLGESDVKALVEDAGKTYVSEDAAMEHLKDNVEKLTSIIITPTTTTIELGKSATFKAEGSFSNGLKKDITSEVTWSSSKPDIAVINGTKVEAKSVGITTIKALYKGINKTVTLTVTAASLESLDINSTDTNLVEGTETKLTVSGVFGDGKESDMTSQVTWSSSDTARATVDATGNVKALSVGEVTITATKGTISDIQIIVISDATLTGIEFIPATQNIAKGLTEQLVVKGTYTNGQIQTLINGLDFNSSDVNVATVDTSGKVTAVKEGTVSINAKSSTFTSQSTVTVTPATISSIMINPLDVANIANGKTVQLSVTGTYSDSSTKDISSQVTWSSTTPTLATVSEQGLVTAKGLGSAKVKATLGALTHETTIMISDATLDSIIINSDKENIPNGLTAQLKVNGTYSDGTTIDITSQTIWTTSDETVAIVSNTGQVTAKKAGTATFTAKVGTVTAQKSLTVSEAILQSVAIKSPSSQIAKGLNTQLEATGTYSDNTTKDLTNQITWNSSNTAVASVESNGQVSALTTGSTQITATIGTVSENVNITVTPTILTSLSASAQSVSLAKGKTTQLSATGTYSDGSTKDVTSQVAWSTNNSFVSVNSAGLATASSVGSSTVTATLSGKTAQTTVEVTAAKLVSISIATIADIEKGKTGQLTATGSYTDNSTKDISSKVTWSSSDTSKATINNTGLIITIQEGTVTMTASLDGVSIQKSVTVLPPVLMSVAIIAPTSEVMLTKTLQLSAIGTYSDGSEKNISDKVLWSNESGTIVSLSTSGLVTAMDLGSEIVKAEINGIVTTFKINAIPLLNTINVSTTQELRQALLDAAQNRMDDEIVLADGIYKTTDDGQGTFIYLSNESNTLILQGSSHEHVILSGDKKHQIFNHNKLDNLESTVVVYNLSFINGNSTSSGGAIRSNNGNIIIYNSTFSENNTSDNYGGAIMIYPGNLEIYNSIFFRNSSKGSGGAIRVRGDAIIEKSLFTQNNTREYIGSNCSGGAIVSRDGGTLFISDSNFTQNVSACGGGGAIYGHIEATNIQVLDNNASGSGGGIRGGGTLSKSLVRGNKCTSYGGGLSFDGDIFNSIIINNHSAISESGGGLYSYRGFVVNNIIANNNSGVVSQTSSFTNNIFFNNIDFDISAIANGVIKVQNNYINEINIQGISVKSNNIFSGITLGFINDLNGNYRLTALSDLIDMGTVDVTDFILPTTDLDDNPRLLGESIDIGPYEFQE